MVKKIRIDDKSQRIIIMSAYGESRFFLKAIEAGVKGFLVKPVETEHLLNVISEQAHDILLEKRLNNEAVKRQIAELERDKGERILQALSQATATFFTHGVNDKSVNNVLKLIGEMTSVSRVYIFKNHEIGGVKYISHTNEWVAKGITAQINNDELVSIPLTDPMFVWWAERMINHHNVRGIIEDFEEPTKTVLISQNIQSLLAIPIYVKDIWWGFIGFDDCISKRIWTDAEISALEMLAFNLGGAIYRRDVEEDMIRLNASLEERVWERTKDLEEEVVERTIAEHLLRDSEEKYRLIYENANDGIFLIMDNIIHLVNPKMSEIMGVLPKNIIGRKFSTLVKSEYSNKVNSFFVEQNIDDVHEKTEFHVQLLNDTWLELKSTSITWDTKPANLVFISDITKRKIAENDLQELNINLEKRIEEEISRANDQQQLLVQKSKLESIGELSAGLAHEINQPLGGLSMGLDNILFNTSGTGEETEYLRKKINLLFKDIERIRKIIEHVRLFSRDQDKLVEEKISVNEVIDNALSLVSKQLLSNNVELKISMPSNILTVLGNKFRLEQVILNLLSNARQALDEKVKHVKSDTFNKQILINLNSDESNVIITVTDNGIGITDNILDKIFNPFFTTKSEKKGTGLGLSISYGIITEMRGVIDVESDEGEFSKVTILLPKI
jgi:PAS domain S-box-containing protein